MTKIWIDHSDGRYYVHELNEPVPEHSIKDVAEIADDVWADYLRHSNNDGIWQALWGSIVNRQYVDWRERQLMPLEDAARENAQLRDELARAQRLTAFYETKYVNDLHQQHRARHAHHHCVYPVPGCDVSELPIDWRVEARDIIENYRQDLADNGAPHQNCCCARDHRVLDPETVDTLRRAGFLVNDPI